MAIGRLTSQLLNESSLGSAIVWQAADSMGGSGPNSKRKKNSQYLVLEPRMMFDGAMESTFETLAYADHDTTETIQIAQDDSSLFDALSDRYVETIALDTSDVTTPREVVFIDDGVEDFDVIMAELGPDVEVFILNANSDGVSQIAAILSNFSDVTALHIISHGDAGELSLGSARLDANSIANEHADELAVIAASLSTHADILIYGCEFGLGEEGQSAMQALANATRADVAASDDLTGTAELGGDWLLETETGFIETGLLRLETWSGTLNLVNTGNWAVVGNTASNTTSGITSTITFAPTAGGTVALNATPQVFNTATGLFTNGAEGDPSLGFTYTWDTTPEAAAGVPQPDATTDDAPMTVTITFSTPVTNPIINIDRLGGNGTYDPNTAIAGDEDSRSNSSLWTITTPGATLTELAGVGHFDVTSTTFQRTSNVVMATTGISGEAGTNALVNTAAGTIQVLGTYTTLTFVVTGIGVEGAGADGIEIGLALDAVPNAQNDSFTMNEDATLTGNLFANNGSGVDADPAGDALIVTQINGATFTVGTPIALANGTLTITNATTGAFTFTPNAHYVSGQPFTYTIADANGGTDTANVNITVNNVNDAPAGTDNTLTTNEDTAIPLSAATFGFSDPNDSPANSLQSVIITTLPTTGTLTLSGGAVSIGQVVPAASLANLLWTPALNSNGTGVSSFTFQVVDNGGTANGGQNTDQSANTITFNVTAQNDPPVAVNDGPIPTQPGTIVNIAPLGNDTDIDADALAITHVVDPATPTSPIALVVETPIALASGTTVTLLTDGTLNVVLAHGNDSIERFDYIISDGNGGADQATITLARDTDGDGVANTVDIDDDNDGILDTVEGHELVTNSLTGEIDGTFGSLAGTQRDLQNPVAGYTYSPGANAGFASGVYAVTSGQFGNTTWQSFGVNFNGNTTGTTDDAFLIVNGSTNVGTFYQQTVTVSPNATVNFGVDARNWASNPFVLSGPPNLAIQVFDSTGTILLAQTTTGAIAQNTNWVTATGTFNTDSNTSVVVRMVNISTQSVGNDFAVDNFRFQQVTPPLFSNVDTDNDGIFDHLDIDSDNDGITDNIEAQSTEGYVAPSGVGGTVEFLDANADGLDDTYDPGALGAAGGIGLTPVNTDSADTADWRDLNSDNDALADVFENGLGVAPVSPGQGDADGDGLKDAFESAIDGEANDGFVVNEGELPYPPTSSGYLPDSGLDSIPTVTPMSADLDFRDATEDNFAPTSTGGAETTPEDTPYIFTAVDFNFADLNPGNTLQSVRIDTLPAQGTLFLGVTPVALGQVIPVSSISTLSYLPPTNLSGANLTSFTYSVNDGIAFAMAPATMQLSVTPVNDPPILNLDPNNDSGTPGDPTDDGIDDAGFVATFIENSIPVKIVDTDMTLTDPENNITEIVVTLTDGLVGDKFTFPSTLPGGISPSTIPTTTLTADGTIVLTFTGAPGTTTADWNALLQLISFEPSSNASDNPNPADRHITVEALDASNASSGELTTTIHVTPLNDPPTLDLDDFDTSGINQGNYQGTFTENGLPVPISDGVVVTDLDDTHLEGMTITLTNGQIADVLTIGVLPAGIALVGVAPSALTVPGTITMQFTGSASLADYQSAIAAIGFSTASQNPVESVREITVVGSDGDDLTPLRTAYITVDAVNDAPLASPMPPNTGVDAAALMPFDVTTYFSDVDNTNGQLIFSLDPATTPSWMSLDGTGNIVGTPPNDASQNTNTIGGTPGVYTISIAATDPDGLAATTTITYTISNPPPDAQEDALGTQENAGALSGNVFGPNPTMLDSDPDSDTFTVTAVAGLTANVDVATAGSVGGTFQIATDGALTFLDNGDFEDLAVGETRDTTITYTITDADGGSDTATVTVTVLGTNDGPVVAIGSEIPNQAGIDDQLITPIDVTAAFSDSDTTDVLTYTATGLPLGLVLDLNTGVISGVLDSSASQNGNTGAPTNGVYTIVVTADDGHGGTVTDTFTFTVSNPPPDAIDDALTVGEDAVLSGLNVMSANGGFADSDPDGDTPLTVTQVNGLSANVNSAVGGSDGGTFIISSVGVVSFDPGADFQYLDGGETATTTVVYQLSDGEGGFDTATVTVTVSGANDAPIPVDPTNPTGPTDPNNYIPDQSGTDGASLTPFATSVYFADPDTSDTLTYSSPGIPAWMILNPTTGEITGLPPLDASTGGPNNDGVYPITIVVSDGDETFSTTLDYTIGNLPPDAVNDSYVANEDTILTVPIATGLIDNNDTDGDGDTLTVSQLNGVALISGVPVPLPSGAIVTLNADGSFDYNPNGAFEALAVGETDTDSFTYHVADGDGLFDTATVTITIEGANDVPVAEDDAFAITENGMPVIGNIFPINDTVNPDRDVDATDVLSVTEVGGNASGVGAPVAGSMGGLFTIDSNGDLEFVDNGEFEDLDDSETRDTTVTYQLSDGHGGFDLATVTVTVTGVNDAPVPVDPNDPTGPTDPNDFIPDVTSTDGATPTDPNVAQYFADPEGDQLTFSAMDLPPGLIMSSDGTITGVIEPDASQGGNVPGQPGVYLVTISADDGDLTTTTTVTYTITNPPPLAHDDNVDVGEDAASLMGNVITAVLPGEVADADTAPDSDVLTVVSANQAGIPIAIGTAFTTAGGGSLTLNGDGSYTFVPGTAYNGLDDGETAVEIINYLVSDGNGGTDPAVLVITINGANDVPVVFDPLNSGDPANPIPADPNTIVPLQTVTDGQAFPVGAPLVDLGPYVVDPDGEPVTFLTTSPLPLGLTLNSDGTVTGTIDPSASQGGDPLNPGVYTIMVEVTDGTGTTPLTLTIDVSNPPPVAVDDTPPAGNEDMNQTGNVLTDGTPDHDTAPDSDLLTVTSFNIPGVGVTPAGSTATIPNVGTLLINPDGSYTFDPASNYDSAVPVVTYTISDGNGGTDEGTLSLTITPVNDLPVVIDPLNPGTPLNPMEAVDPDNIIPDIAATDGATSTDPNVAQYFADPEGNPLTFTAADLPPGLTMNPDGTITGVIDPDASQGGNVPGQPGVYLVTITADDGNGGVTTTIVTYTITNPAPVAVDDAPAAGDEDVNQTGNVLTDGTPDHDTAPDSDLLIVTSFIIPGVGVTPAGSTATIPNVGTLLINPDGSYTFDPASNYDGPVPVVTYTISDGNGGTDEGTLSLTITPVNDPPVVIDPLNPGTPLNPIEAVDPDNIIPDIAATDGATSTDPNVAQYFADPEGDPLTFAATDLPPGLVMNSDGAITGVIDPDASQGGNVPGQPGVYLVTITADDGDLTTTTTVTFTVSNIPPIAVDDVSSALEDLTQNGNVLTDPATGDADGGLDTDSLTVVSVAGGTLGAPIILPYGTLTLNADGTWNFAPNAAANALPVGVTATEQVTYTINDGNGGIDTARLTINLIGTNDAPLAVDLPDQSNYEGAAISIPASVAFTDPDGDALTFTATGLPAGLTIDSLTGVISGTIDNGAANFGPYTIVVTADDGHGGTVTTTFDWEVLALGAPSIEQPQGPASLPQLGSGILSEGQDFILRSVATLRPLDGTPELGKRAVTTATNGLTELNGNVDLIVGDGIISQLVEWLGRQGKQANWMHDLFEAMEHEPYVGDSLDLALTLDGTDLFRIKTVIHNGALYFGVDETADGAQVVSISETGAFGLPNNVTRISAQDIIANLTASSNWLDLTIVGQLADGRRLSWMVSVNPNSGEVIASNFKNGLIANHHIESGDQLSAQLLQPFDYAAE